ncbi:GTP 3',8-cyclase MoaA [Microbulbifer agarilyticus]|uniref:GTP 3',8-cyclase MoaA n=1 Tax=Microbulbifer agarilyticus TaxID=260552 RepID=UPI001C9675BE|nr:GTP 3',8-cyclase MoaA [Microbulbifer agarilyticus]MBY6190436.1 GTP 3',8-cyclase MoaA [Microbulbifer agarilyticus]
MKENRVLEDGHGRRFYYLRLSVTDVCNFRCDYCLPDGYQASPKQPDLSVAEATTVMRAFAQLGTRKVRLTGGEPSLRKDLPQLIQAAKTTPGIRRVAVTSNGYKLPTAIDTWHHAGLDQLNISIDSLDPSEFAHITGHDCLPKILTGIDRALELGVQTKVNAVLLSDGARNRLQQFLAWLKTTPVTLRFIELMQTGDNRDYFASNHLRGAEIEQLLIETGWQILPRAIDAGPAREYVHPDYAGRIGLITPYSKDFCSSCNRLRISAQGKLHLCLFSDAGIDLRHAIRDGDASALAESVRTMIGNKEVSHYLQQGNTGGTENLSIIGG